MVLTVECLPYEAWLVDCFLVDKKLIVFPEFLNVGMFVLPSQQSSLESQFCGIRISTFVF